MLSNHYDVTTWPHGNPCDDIGEVINSIIANVKARQADRDTGDGGKPGAAIYIPPGDYRLRTQVLIDISFLRIYGSGHGFASSSIRFNTPRDQWDGLHELWPGGSRVLVDLAAVDPDDPTNSAAILVERGGNPRISSVEFSGFCIDGLHYTGSGANENPENSYRNGKTGIYIADANDSFTITSMGFIYLEHALTVHKADALSVHDNFIVECGNCIELRGWGQASKITDNLIGAGPDGHSIYAENHGGLLVAANNVFPRGRSSIHFSRVTRSNVTSNRLHSFYSGMMVLAGGSSENLIATNHFFRDREPWVPFQGVDNGRDDLYGLLRIAGNNNSVIGNHFSEIIDSATIRPTASIPVIMRLVEGVGNYVASNHVVALDASTITSDSAVAGQVNALLTMQGLRELTVITVQIDAAAAHCTVLDSGTELQVNLDPTVNAFRPTPGVTVVV